MSNLTRLQKQNLIENFLPFMGSIQSYDALPQSEKDDLMELTGITEKDFYPPVGDQYDPEEDALCEDAGIEFCPVDDLVGMDENALIEAVDELDYDPY